MENNKTTKEELNKRSSILWSGSSIMGYIWDVVINIILILIILSIYSSIHDSASVIIVSLSIFIYLSIVSIGAQLSQGLIKNSIRTTFLFNKIIKEIKKETDENLENETEGVGFALEKIHIKYIINSIFHFIVFVIALLNLISSL